MESIVGDIVNQVYANGDKGGVTVSCACCQHVVGTRFGSKIESKIADNTGLSKSGPGLD